MSPQDLTDAAAQPCPGVYWEDVYPPPPRTFRTGVPAFIGYAKKGVPLDLLPVTRLAEFTKLFGAAGDGYLTPAVRGFFENGGELCYVLPLEPGVEPQLALEHALTALERSDEIDLVCAPDLARAENLVELQRMILNHCDQPAANRVAILDSLAGAHLRDSLEKQWRELTGRNAALYFPWIQIQEPGGSRMVPPCGHVAGIFARTDAAVGVFKAPANEVVEGATGLQTNLTSTDQGAGDPFGVVNCLRSFPGRGIRVWGARTISGDSEWKYVNVLRLVLSTSRWLEEFMSDVVMEPNTPALRGRIRREVNDYLYKLFRRGALQGDSPDQAYFVRCNRTTTSPDDADAGRVIAEIGVAPVNPNEFIVVRLIHRASAVAVTGAIEQTA